MILTRRWKDSGEEGLQNFFRESEVTLVSFFCIRFWKSGYWKNHLAGKPYHISALYVVDLVKFRQVAAGDRLRGQYQVQD